MELRCAMHTGISVTHGIWIHSKASYMVAPATAGSSPLLSSSLDGPGQGRPWGRVQALVQLVQESVTLSVTLPGQQQS